MDMNQGRVARWKGFGVDMILGNNHLIQIIITIDLLSCIFHEF